jgi:hypothetical protein
MSPVPNRGWVLPMVDLVLLVVFLKIGFLLNPQPRPELAMLGAAAVVQLFVGPRAGRSTNRALVSAGLVGLLYTFYWHRAADLWPLLPWLGIPVWVWAIGWLARSGIGHRVVEFSRRGVGRLVMAWERAQSYPAMRWAPVSSLVVAGLFLMSPYLASGIIGAGDARWYSKTVADYVVQMRAGFFPLWAAQSDWSFYGGIFPLRLAPYLAHLAGLVDVLTLRQLPPWAVMNVCLTVSLVGGLLSMFWCVRAILPGRPWIAVGLSLLYGLCPGVIGLAYAQDLYMSFCTLPFLPVAFLGAVRTFTRDDLAARLLLVGGLAAAWLAHPPIGMWAGAVLAVTQVVRWLSERGWRTSWRYDVVALGLFVLLAAYPVISVRSLGEIADGNPPASLHYGSIRDSFPANWLPVHRLVRALHNLQVGYGLAVLGLFVGWQVWRPGHAKVARLLVTCAAGLMVMLLPIPVLTPAIWQAMPQVVLNITNTWPAQRLLVLLAVCVVMATAVWLGREETTDRQRVRCQWLLIAALVWGGLEVTKFLRRGVEVSGGWKQAVLEMRPENRTMVAAALGPLRVQPRTFNHGVTDVQLEHRFLTPDMQRILRNNTDAILPGVGPGEGQIRPRLKQTFTGVHDPELPLLHLQPRLTLQPGRHYLLGFEFDPARDYRGILKMEGPDFVRVYRLPDAGNGLSFGTTAVSARWIALWQTTGRPEEIRLMWIPDDPAAWSQPGMPFANFEMREYDPASLDIVVESLVPYRVKVNAPAAGYLETPRISYPTYRATVNGREVATEVSPDGFVTVPVEPGRHQVQLTYAPPLATRLAYWMGAVSWIGFLAGSGWYLRRELVKK